MIKEEITKNFNTNIIFLNYHKFGVTDPNKKINLIFDYFEEFFIFN